MKLYDTKTKQIQELELIETNEGLMYVSFLSNDDLVKNGYKRVIEEPAPNNDDPSKKLVLKSEETKDSFRIFFEIEELSQEEKDAQALADVNAQIEETESYIRHAILIGNDSALPELREEYKELLAQKQALEKGENKDEKEN
jgi:hypothetical protein|uniref:Uncharacterized protein n=1 Tax=Myoviridae sp. ctJHU2 TaxID=2823540 RepID=A0A8S5LEK0_9CAUD|nr:MAG TPA: hypothetical protein [Myoviridae sp. ctJHU2]DAX91069.1 MAG TPA: hypothetical protein [Caudoviricetes sp.]